MGRDKLSLEVGGTSLLARVHDALARFCDEVVIVGDGGGDLAPKARRIPDALPGRQGPLAGLEAGLGIAAGDVVFVAAGDMPFVGVDLGRHLVSEVLRGSQAAVPVEGGAGGRLHPLCAAYRADALPVVRAALEAGVRDMRGFICALEVVSYVAVDDGTWGEPEEILLNVNSPEDLRRARRISGDGGRRG